MIAAAEARRPETTSLGGHVRLIPSRRTSVWRLRAAGSSGGRRRTRSEWLSALVIPR